MSSIFGFGDREKKENRYLAAIESIAASLKVLADATKYAQLDGEKISAAMKKHLPIRGGRYVVPAHLVEAECDCDIKQAQAEVGKPHGGPLA